MANVANMDANVTNMDANVANADANVANMDANVANMDASTSADSEEDYHGYDEYEENEDYGNSGKCKKFINNTSAVKPVTKKPVARVKPVKKPKVEKPVVVIVKEERKEVEVVDCWEDLL